MTDSRALTDPSAASQSSARHDADKVWARFAGHLQAALHTQTWQQLIVATPTAMAEPDLQRVSVRPIDLRGSRQLSFVYRYRTRDITKNHPPEIGLTLIQTLLAGAFKNAHLHTTKEDIQLAISKKGKASLRIGRMAGSNTGASTNPELAELQPAEKSAQHNRAKQRYVEQSRAFLQRLGVTDSQAQVLPSMARKWKQINKFIEVFAHAIARSGLADAQRYPLIRVKDFGCGKAYLTFAVHDYLLHTLRRQAQVTGLELRADLVAFCQQQITQLGLQGLTIDQGDIRTHQTEPLDVMIALHACDTATDYALHLGIQAGAEIIMCSPCCHKQLRPQLLSPHPLRPLLQHGIHLGQEAEMLTDGLRALLLEAQGYDTQIFEFISLEHTNKNKMILAIKRSQPLTSAKHHEISQQIAQLKAFYGIREHALEQLLQPIA